VHFHRVVPDAVFVIDKATGELSSVPVPAPSDDEVLAILDRVVRRVSRRLAEEAVRPRR
jgi:hypothetical protein